MPPTPKKHSTRKDHGSQPYPKKTTTTGMTSPTSPTSPRVAPEKRWNSEDDTQLLQARKQNMNWEQIAKQKFPTKTANACRKRHERLINQRQDAEDWDYSKIEAMASAYLQHRERIWKIVAEGVDEKWQLVEAKCMELGVKNLTQTGRSAQHPHRQRTASGNINPDDNSHNDSGFVDGSFQADHPYLASSAPPSHSSQRTISDASSYNATPLPQHASPPGPSTQQQMYPSPQHPLQYPHQQQQSIPSIASLLASTSGPNPGAIATTN